MRTIMFHLQQMRMLMLQIQKLWKHWMMRSLVLLRRTMKFHLQQILCNLILWSFTSPPNLLFLLGKAGPSKERPLNVRSCLQLVQSLLLQSLQCKFMLMLLQELRLLQSLHLGRGKHWILQHMPKCKSFSRRSDLAALVCHLFSQSGALLKWLPVFYGCKYSHGWACKENK